MKVVSLVAGGEIDLGFVPAGKTSAKDSWWSLLLGREAANVKITGLAGDLYALERDGRPFMFDRSVAVFATSGAVSATWLKTSLQKHGVAFFKVVDQTAAAGGLMLFLVELSQKIADGRDGIFSLDAELNGIKLKFAGLLGGYNLPKQSSAPDKIISLN